MEGRKKADGKGKRRGAHTKGQGGDDEKRAQAKQGGVRCVRGG